MRNIMINVLILGAGGQIARHVINQLADKQTIKQTLFARQPAKIHKPYPTNSQIIIENQHPLLNVQRQISLTVFTKNPHERCFGLL